MRVLDVAPVVLLALTAAGCVRNYSPVNRPGEPTSAKFAATSYINSGTEADVIVDVRAAQLTGQETLLPLLVAIEVKGAKDWSLARESFVLELPSGNKMPLAGYDEFVEVYRRARSDLRMGQPFVETLFTTYPEPPFVQRRFDFFPEKASGRFPRDKIDIRKGEVVWGYLYFALPETAPAGIYKLLLSPAGYDETLVIDFKPYKGGGTG